MAIPVNATNAGEVAKTVKEGAVVGPSTVRRSPSFATLARVLLKAQAEAENPVKNADNLHFRSKYANLVEVRSALLPVLNSAGVVVLQFPCEHESGPALTTLLIHPESGEWIETTIGLHPAKRDPQALGSAITYARRYALMAIVGVAPDDDDDGHAASQPPPQRQQAQQRQQPQGNPKLRAQYAQRLAQCSSRKDYEEICRNFNIDVERGNLHEADQEPLRDAFRDAASRNPKPQTVKA